jgi:MFS transporter, DHA1 family, inner membrane transport protein
VTWLLSLFGLGPFVGNILGGRLADRVLMPLLYWTLAALVLVVFYFVAENQVASAVNIGLFNLGNAIGAWAGGAVIANGFGYAPPNWAGAILSLGALILAILCGLLGRKDEGSRFRQA